MSMGTCLVLMGLANRPGGMRGTFELIWLGVTRGTGALGICDSHWMFNGEQLNQIFPTDNPSRQITTHNN